MLCAIALAATLVGVKPEYAEALNALLREHRQIDSGDPFVKAQVYADLNGDEVLDGVIVFSYRMGPNMDHTHSEFLTIVSS